MENVDLIIDSLQKVLCTATSTVSDSRVENNDYFKRRVLGFKAEIEFEKAVKDFSASLEFVEGGQFISKKISGEENDKNKFIYTTIDFLNPNTYLNVYKTIAEWDEVDEMLYIQIIDDNWGEETFRATNRDGVKIDTEIITPNFIFFQYNKNTSSFSKHEVQNFSIILSHFDTPARSPSLFKIRGDEQFKYFAQYDIQTLKKIYATRYFLDNILRQAQGRQLIDLDGFILKGEKVVLVEIKEKTPIMSDESNQSSWQYGWDSRRLLWYLYLLNKIKLPVLYNVRRVKNRESREFLQWDSLFIDDFLKGVSWSNSRAGGGGEDTLIAPYLFFRRLTEILKSI
jgi:hypothetical protein